MTAAADCAVELDVVAVADDVVELLVDAPVVEDPDTVEALPLVLDVTAEALDVAAEVLEVTAEALDVVAWDVVGAEALDTAAAELLAVAALLMVVDVWVNAGTGVTVGEVAVPVAPALHAASKATLLAAPNWASNCKQRRRPSCAVAVGSERMTCSLTTYLQWSMPLTLSFEIGRRRGLAIDSRTVAGEPQATPCS